MRKLELITETTTGGSGVTTTYNQMNLESSIGGAPDYALAFDNTSYTENIPIGLNYLTNTRTISLRVKLDTTTFNGQSRNFLYGQYGGSGQRTTYLEFRDTGVLRAYVPTTSTGNTSVLIESDAGVYFNADQWYYISLVMTGTRAEIYVDNVLQSNTATTSVPFSRSGGTFTLGVIGAIIPSLAFTGTMQDVSVWNDARTQTELLADETRVFTGSEAGLKGHWSMDEGSGTTITDASGTQVKTISSTNVVSDMWVSQATTTTYNDRIDLGNSVENGVKTTEFWFKLPATTRASTPKFSMLSSYDVSNSERGRQIVSIDNGIIDWEVFTTGTASVSINSNAGVYFNAGQYYHLALLNNGGLISIYVDSVLQSGGAGCPITALKTVAVDTYINGLFNPLSEIGDFTIKNLQYWNIVRTPAEITADKDVYYPIFTTGLSESWHFTNTTGANTVGVSGTTAIITTDTGGVTRINNIIRENFNHTSSGIPTTVIDTQEFDLFVGEAINVKTQGVNIDNISNTESGTTNSFQLPTTANNNKIFDYLNLVGSVSDFPYRDNYVRYSESGVELIVNGRLKVNEMSNNGYKVEVLHGINDFFDKIRGKFLHEAYEPFRSTLTEMRYQDTTLCNTTSVRDTEGYCVPLMDLAGVNPIADFQQTVGYFLDFGLNKISDAIGYTYTNNGIDLTDYVFTKSEPPTFDTRVTSFVSNRYFAGYEEIVQENRLVWSHVMTVKGVINFQQMRMRVIAGVGLPSDPDINVMVNGVLLAAYTLGVGGAALNTTLNTTPIEYNAGDVIQIYFDATGIGSGNSVYLVDAYFQGYYTLGYKVYHENILGDYNQTDFVKNIMQTFNLGINVNSISKEVELYSLNTVYGNGGVINDFSKYYDETKKRIFKSSYGKNNKFTYKYIEKDVSFVKSDGILVANNTNEDKTIIESELTASSNYTPLTLGAIDALLTSVIAYDSKSVNAKPTNIGDRFNQVIRVEDTVANPVTVSYIDKNGATGNVTSDQSFLTFGGLDWNTLIDTQFNNLRDKVLNRYEKYTVIMNVPLHVINEYDFKEKVYIKELGSNFVVNNITTLNGGLNQWELIKIN